MRRRHRSFLRASSLVLSSATLIARTSLAFISFTYFLGLDLALDDLGLDRQLVAGKTQSFASGLFGDAGDLEHDTTGLNNCHPIFRGAFTGTHTGLSRLLSNGLIGEDLDPDLTAALGVARHGDTGCFDLIAGDPRGLNGLKTVFTVGDGVAARCLTGEAATLHSAVFYSLGQKHYCAPP